MPPKNKRQQKAAPAADVDPSAIYDEVDALVSKGQFDKIPALCDKLATEQTAQMIKAVALIRSENHKDALQCIEQSNATTQLAFERAYCLYRLNRPQESLAALDAGEDQSSKKMLMLKGQILYRLERYQDCLDVYNQLLDVVGEDDEEFGDVLINIQAAQAQHALVSKSHRAADAKATPKAAEVGNSYEALYNHACCLIAQERPDAAVVVLERARKQCADQFSAPEDKYDLEREMFPILTQLAYAHHALGQFDAAYEHYQTVLRLQGEHALSFKSHTTKPKAAQQQQQRKADSGSKGTKAKTHKHHGDVTRVIALNNLISLVLTDPAFFAGKASAEGADPQASVAARNVSYEALKKLKLVKAGAAECDAKLNGYQKQVLALNEAVAALNLHKFAEATQLLAPHLESEDGAYISLLLEMLKAHKHKEQGVSVDTLKAALSRFPHATLLHLLLLQVLLAASEVETATKHLDQLVTSANAPACFKCIQLKLLSRKPNGEEQVVRKVEQLHAQLTASGQPPSATSVRSVVQHLARLYCQRGAYGKAAQLYEAVVKGGSKVLDDQASWVALLSFDRPDYAAKMLDALTEQHQLSGALSPAGDLETIESGKGILRKSYKIKGAAPADKSSKQQLKSNKRKRKARLPRGVTFAKDYTPDPERWLPKRLRSSYKAPKGRKGAKSASSKKPPQLGGHQGGASDSAAPDEMVGIGGTGSAGIFGKVRGRKEAEVPDDEDEHNDGTATESVAKAPQPDVAKKPPAASKKKRGGKRR
ncbi:Signal recognition particle subunit SRP72 [Sorochytrium milnesiophthora]